MNSNKTKYLKFYKSYSEYFPYSMNPDFLETVCGTYWDACIAMKGEEVQAVWPYYFKSKLAMNYVTMPVLCKWMGPVFQPQLSPDKKQKVLKVLLDQMPKFSFYDQNFYYNIEDWSPFHWHGFKQDLKYSFRIDLKQSEDQILKGMSGQYRKIVKDFSVSDFRIIEDQDLASFYKGIQKLFKRKEMKVPYTYQDLLKQYELLYSQGLAKLFTIKDKSDSAHASVLLFLDDHSAYTHIIVDDPKYRSEGASIYIIWHLIKWVKEQHQLKFFDFEGSMIKSVQKVRKNFGAKQVPYFRARKEKNIFYTTIKNALRGG